MGKADMQSHRLLQGQCCCKGLNEKCAHAKHSTIRWQGALHPRAGPPLTLMAGTSHTLQLSTGAFHGHWLHHRAELVVLSLK